MCERVFNKPDYFRYSSSNVIHEVNHTKNKRLKLYGILIDFLNNGSNIDTFNPEIFDIHLNYNDRKHLKQLIEFLSQQRNIESTMRAYYRNYTTCIQDGINNLVSVFNSIDNPYIRDTIADDVIHREDAEIILDAYYWSVGRTDPKYITLERRAIINNRDRIIHILKNQCGINPPSNIELLYVAELPD